jgi:TolB-like protein
MMASANEVVSVLYFENTTQNSDYDWISKGLADMLITDLAQAGPLIVVEREALEKFLKEQALSLSGIMEENRAVKVGKLLDANQLVYGSYIINGKDIRIDARIANVSTGAITAGIETSGKIKKIFELEKALAQKILGQFSITVPLQATAQETMAFDALQTYYEGISLFDKGDIQQALEKFLKAKDLDPLSLKPQEGLAAAYQFLKDFQKLRQQREITRLYQLADQLNARLKADAWKTYADLVREKNYVALSPQEQEKFNQTYQAYVVVNTPAQCAWRVMVTFVEIGQLSVSYFNDTATQKKLNAENVRIAEKTKGLFPGDPFLSEILYMQIVSLNQLGRYQELKPAAESFMTAYPDYRMIQGVEDYYKKALEQLQ